jgi:hypothetical protein
VENLTPEHIAQYGKQFSSDPGFIKVLPNGRDRTTYVYKALMVYEVGLFDCIEIAECGWAMTEARLLPRLLKLRSEGVAKTKCAIELEVSLGQVNRWLAGDFRRR